MTEISVNRVEDLVRAGKVRVALFPPQYSKEATSGELRGWAVGLAGALGARLGIEVLLLEYPGPRKVLEALEAGTCDVAFLGMDRAAEVDFSSAIIQIDFTCLVPAESSIRSIADADQSGLRIAVVSDHASTVALSRILKQAELVPADVPDAALDLLRNGRADLLASVRPWLLEVSSQLPGSRVLDDRYGANVLAMAVPKKRAGWLADLNEFIEEAKAAGLVRRAIERAGWRGVEVAPARKSNDQRVGHIASAARARWPDF